jgi:ring-1,2-phenylacetyl-CoA epoxidase subunit PaaC
MHSELHVGYLLQLGDNALVLAQRLGEWCGHGPMLEQDIALTNIALDLVGQARNLYQHAAEIEGKGRKEDDLAYFRNERQFRNLLLTEQENGHWGKTILRQFFFDAFNYYNYQALCQSKDAQLAAIAEKAIKEVTYHLRFSSEWMIRLGDGTPESNARMQEALSELWTYTGEATMPSIYDDWAVANGIGVDLLAIKPTIEAKIVEVLAEAKLEAPEQQVFMQSGGKQGKHTEVLGVLLAEMQHLSRSFPGAEW